MEEYFEGKHYTCDPLAERLTYEHATSHCSAYNVVAAAVNEEVEDLDLDGEKIRLLKMLDHSAFYASHFLKNF